MRLLRNSNLKLYDTKCILNFTWVFKRQRPFQIVTLKLYDIKCILNFTRVFERQRPFREFTFSDSSITNALFFSCCWVNCSVETAIRSSNLVTLFLSSVKLLAVYSHMKHNSVIVFTVSFSMNSNKHVYIDHVIPNFCVI